MTLLLNIPPENDGDKPCILKIKVTHTGAFKVVRAPKDYEDMVNGDEGGVVSDYFLLSSAEKVALVHEGASKWTDAIEGVSTEEINKNESWTREIEPILDVA